MKNIDNNHVNFQSNLENLKLKNKLHGKELDMKCQNQEKIYNNISMDLNGQDWERCLSNFEELNNNSKDMRQMMKTQNEIVQDTFSLTENILISLENTSKQKQILRYNDWVVTLIDEIIVPGLGVGGRDAWIKISNAYTRNMSQNTIDFEYFEYKDDEEEQLFEQLEDILDKVNMTIEDFDWLIKLNKMRNAEFHINAQPIDEAKKQLEMPFPDDFECYKEPLKKALDAIETQWKNNSKQKKRSRKRKPKK